jgi:hypothetical protein
MGIKNLSSHKRVFLSRIMPILHDGAEIGGKETVAQLESIQLGYFKRLFGLYRIIHSQSLNGDLVICYMATKKLQTSLNDEILVENGLVPE